ncbi:uncharacterized protein LOC132195032 [Neocloeon triangulifer]|uniref:uncharacterized protein LOC132195032 n=1 Tax=Neocloeon triangulifer TaxID=2078957 RepID=UPI00286F51E2|nr:uncharacterized protein LOC132195032 [Neocloeon triangulifer]
MGERNASQEFLDSHQYSDHSISRYEKIFGRTYVSTGGEGTTKGLTKKMNLKPGQRVLDVGCGTGGSAFYLAKTYGVQVLGLDLSRNMINKAKQYQGELDEETKKLIEFQVADVLKVSLPEESFDAVYSRDAILHIGNKEELFANLFKWVRPGGQLLITDYARGQDKCGEEFEDYVAGRGYRLLTVPKYGKLLEDAGWKQVQAIDNTEEFVSTMKRELDLLNSIKESFISEFSQKDFNDLENGWTKKLNWVDRNEHVWGLYMAKKF